MNTADVKPKINPELPPGTKISRISNKGITYYWKKVERTDGYEILRSYSEQGPFERIALIETSRIGTYTDSEFDHEQDAVFYALRTFFKDSGNTLRYSRRTLPRKAERVTALTLSHEVLYIPSGTRRRISAALDWGDAPDCKWVSSDPAIAEVSSKGIVKGVSAGSCVVTCTCSKCGDSVPVKVVVDRENHYHRTELQHRYFFDPKTGAWEQLFPSGGNTAIITMAGDAMCSMKQTNAAHEAYGGWDFRNSFDCVRKINYLADFSIVNLETLLASCWPYVTEETMINNQYNANGPVQFLDAVAYGGFDALVMSNNHCCDGGPAALRETIKHVDDAGLARTGAFLESDPGRFFIVNVNGIKVGFVAYNSPDTGYNGKNSRFKSPKDESLLCTFSPEAAKQAIDGCRKSGAEYVVAYMHWGKKNYRKPTEEQEREAQQVADSGADLIVGSNPHLVQKFDILKSCDGRSVPCYYSIGNFLASMNQVEGNLDSIVIAIVLERREDGSVVLKDNCPIPFHTFMNNRGRLWMTSEIEGGQENKRFRALSESLQSISLSSSKDVFSLEKPHIVRAIASCCNRPIDQVHAEVDHAYGANGIDASSYYENALYDLPEEMRGPMWRHILKERNDEAFTRAQMVDVGFDLFQTKRAKKEKELQEKMDEYGVDSATFQRRNLGTLSQGDATKALLKEANRIHLLAQKTKTEKNKCIQRMSSKSGLSAEESRSAMESAEKAMGVSFNEFAAYRLWRFDEEKKRSFFIRFHKRQLDDLYNMDNQKTATELGNKVSAASRYRKLMKRTVLATEGLSLVDFSTAFSSEKKIIYKPLVAANEKSVAVFDLAKMSLADVHGKIEKKGPGVVEGMLSQHSTMDSLYPGAVNTIRLATVKTFHLDIPGVERGSVHFLYAIARMGKEGSVTDSFVTGGLVAEVDVESGVIQSKAVNRRHQPFVTHPDTGIDINGFQIPYFKEAKALIERAYKKIEGYFEWDICIGGDGPILMGVGLHPKTNLLQPIYAAQGVGKFPAIEKFIPRDIVLN